jgi:hypothetical protein
LLEHTRKFPRHERFRLAKRIDDSLFDFHHCLLRAVRADDVQEPLEMADMHLNALRAYLRIALELGYSTDKQYAHAAKHTAELGRLLGGWQKSLRSE